MLTIAWVTAIVAFMTALAALAYARRASRRVDEVSEKYWHLRYEHGQLTSRVARLEPSEGGREPEQSVQPAKIAAFVPLSSLKR